MIVRVIESLVEVVLSQTKVAGMVGELGNSNLPLAITYPEILSMSRNILPLRLEFTCVACD